jgi:hypothetical protein
LSLTSRQLPATSRIPLLETKILRIYLIDVGWLLLLILYVAAGMRLTPFHGDEAMHLYTSHDYATAFIYRQPQQLLVTPPYDIDSDSRLRLLNGSVMRYSVGFKLATGGFNRWRFAAASGLGLGFVLRSECGYRTSPI